MRSSIRGLVAFRSRPNLFACVCCTPSVQRRRVLQYADKMMGDVWLTTPPAAGSCTTSRDALHSWDCGHPSLPPNQFEERSNILAQIAKHKGLDKGRGHPRQSVGSGGGASWAHARREGSRRRQERKICGCSHTVRVPTTFPCALVGSRSSMHNSELDESCLFWTPSVY